MFSESFIREMIQVIEVLVPGRGLFVSAKMFSGDEVDRETIYFNRQFALITLIECNTVYFCQDFDSHGR